MIINVDETCTLIINNINKFDSGIYTYRLEDRLITVSDVKIQESPAQFIDRSQSYLVWKRREDDPISDGIGSCFFETEPNRTEKISNRTEPNRLIF
jgi:hypothetical protein